jgi:hypothetical protein
MRASAGKKAERELGLGGEQAPAGNKVERELESGRRPVDREEGWGSSVPGVVRLGGGDRRRLFLSWAVSWVRRAVRPDGLKGFENSYSRTPLKGGSRIVGLYIYIYICMNVCHFNRYT